METKELATIIEVVNLINNKDKEPGKEPQQIKPSIFKVGDKWFFRTVTLYHVGRIMSVDGDLVMLESASWVADTGRLGEALKTGKFKEFENFPGICVVNLGGLIDAAPWPHPLPAES
jgi:hypothetical protein